MALRFCPEVTTKIGKKKSELKKSLLNIMEDHIKRVKKLIYLMDLEHYLQL